MSTATEKNRYTTFRIYHDAKGLLVFAEGNLCKDPHFIEATEKKKAFVGVNMACGDLDIPDLCRKAGLDIPEEVSGPWLSCAFFGNLAKKMSKLKKGHHIFVFGRLTYEERNDFKYMHLNGSGFFAPSYKDRPEVNGVESCVPFTNMYESNSGDMVSNPMALMVATVEDVGDLEEGAKCDWLRCMTKTEANPALIYDLANGDYSKDREYKKEGGKMSAVFFRKTAARMDKLLRPDMKILTAGRVNKDVNEETGAVYYGIIPDTICVVGWPPRPNEGDEPQKEKTVKGKSKAAEKDKSDSPAPTLPKKAPKKPETPPVPDFVELDDEDEEDMPF